VLCAFHDQQSSKQDYHGDYAPLVRGGHPWWRWRQNLRQVQRDANWPVERAIQAPEANPTRAIQVRSVDGAVTVVCHIHLAGSQVQCDAIWPGERVIEAAEADPARAIQVRPADGASKKVCYIHLAGSQVQRDAPWPVERATEVPEADPTRAIQVRPADGVVTIVCYVHLGFLGRCRAQGRSDAQSQHGEQGQDEEETERACQGLVA